MKKRNTSKPNKFLVFFSYFFPVISGLAVGFFIPKILGVEDYGYYKLFNLYSGYCLILSLGFVSGIYLKYGGFDYANLNKQEFRLYTRFFLSFQTIFSLIGVLLTVFLAPEPYRFIFSLVFIYQLIYNVFYYYDIITTITQEYRTMIWRNFIQSILSIINVGIVFALRNQSLSLYELYVSLFVVSYFILLVWYLIKYRDITFGRCQPLHGSLSSLISLFKIGLPLLFADMISNLIFSTDRQIVSLFFDNTTFSTYSFAYNILQVFTKILYSFSAIIYPELKRANKDKMKETYYNSTILVMIISSFSFISYFFLFYLIKYYLTEYQGSLETYKYVILSLPANCLVSIVTYSFYKSDQKQNSFFVISLVILLLGIGSDLLCYYVFKNTLSLVIASIIVCFIWYFLTDLKYIKQYKYKFWIPYLYEAINIGLYLICAEILKPWVGFLVYFACFIVFTLLFFYKQISSLFNSLLQHRKSKNKF